MLSNLPLVQMQMVRSRASAPRYGLTCLGPETHTSEARPCQVPAILLFVKEKVRIYLVSVIISVAPRSVTSAVLVRQCFRPVNLDSTGDAWERDCPTKGTGLAVP